MRRDPALDWLKEHDPEATTPGDPEATTPGWGDRYAPVPRRPRKEVLASLLDRVDENGTEKSFEFGLWAGPLRSEELWYDDDPGAGAYVPADEDLDDDLANAHPVLLDLRRPVNPYRKALAERLTAAELVHLRWIEHGDPQSDIAERLGISQPAVAKRERVLLAKVDAVHVGIMGRPYAQATRRRPGVRSRKIT